MPRLFFLGRPFPRAAIAALFTVGMALAGCAGEPGGGNNQDGGQQDASRDAETSRGNITVSPDPVDFGFPLLHTNTSRTVTIGNNGDGDLTLTEILVIDADGTPEYSVQPTGAVNIVIPPNATEDVQVTLHPVDDEVDLGTLSVHSNDPDNPVVSVLLLSDHNGDPTIGICVLDDTAGIPVPFVDCHVDTVNSEPLIDFGVVPIGTPVTEQAVIRNEANGNHPLRIDSVVIQSDSTAIENDMQLRLFMYDADGVTEIDVTPPLYLSAGDPTQSIEPDLLYADVTFGANVDGIVTNTWLVVTCSDPNAQPVPMSGAVSGCPPNYWDANGDPNDGCEYYCVYTGPEICSSGQDDNCDGTQDEDGSSGCVIYYLDMDQDNYGVTSDWRCLCAPNTVTHHTATADGDCDDNDPQRNPGEPELCDGLDNDCNGLADAPGGEVDGDNDGVLSCDDCNDGDPDNYPGNTEVCDGQDNNCNGLADFPGGEVDGDNDGSLSCEDCDDGDPDNFPGNTEICDGQDNNCNSFIDQAEVPVSVLCGAVPNATETCAGAAGCVITGCTVADYYDTNGTYSDGCECQADPLPSSAGSSCAAAIDLGILSDSAGDQVTDTGNTPFAGREIWYVFNATDDWDNNGDEFHVDVRFLANPGAAYVMDVYRGGCPGVGSQLANNENCCFDWYTNFNSTSTGCTVSAPCGEGNCSTTSQPGRNICSNDTDTFYVRVRHSTAAPLCSQFTIELSNGVY